MKDNYGNRFNPNGREKAFRANEEEIRKMVKVEGGNIFEKSS